MQASYRRIGLCLFIVFVVPMLMAPSGGIEGCAGFYSYNECQEGQKRECYTGPAATKGQGTCKSGEQTCSAEGTWGACAGEVTPTTDPAGCKVETTTNPSVLAKGTFVGASNHTTVGDVEVTKEGDKEIIKLSASFKTDNGPQLRLYVVDDEKGAISGDNFIDIAPLTSITGEQTYEMPAGKSISSYKSVVIWCKPFSVNFGYATLVKP